MFPLQHNHNNRTWVNPSVSHSLSLSTHTHKSTINNHHKKTDKQSSNTSSSLTGTPKQFIQILTGAKTYPFSFSSCCESEIWKGISLFLYFNQLFCNTLYHEQKHPTFILNTKLNTVQKTFFWTLCVLIKGKAVSLWITQYCMPMCYS